MRREEDPTMRRRKEVAARVPNGNPELIERLENKIDIREAKKALADARKHGTIPWKKVKNELGL
jgi:hypothetical protein